MSDTGEASASQAAGSEAAALPDSAVPETAMDSGSDTGSPGERADSVDALDAAVQDDSPLPAGSSEVGSPGTHDDGLAPDFSDS